MCKHCNRNVGPLTSGSYRNHCPFCLYSKHVDIVPGDRSERCHGLMQPIGVDYSAKKGWIIIHQCYECHIVRRNRAALDGEQPDDYEAIIKLASFQ